MPTMSIQVYTADYHNTDDCDAIKRLLNEYAQDPMGGEKALEPEILDELINKLQNIPHALSFILTIDGKPQGLLNAFETLSTFKAKPLLNIHDVYINSQYRGLGLSQKLLNAIEKEAKQRGCCKLTLEVLSENTLAQAAYERFGFSAYELKKETGTALFWEKEL